MKLRTKVVVAHLLCSSIFAVNAQTYDDSTQGTSGTGTGTDSSSGTDTSRVEGYIKNWAGYLGYDVTTEPDPQPTANSNDLIDFTQTVLAETYLYNTLFGSIPTVTRPNDGSSSNASSTSTQGLPFVPASTASAAINNESNLTFQSFSQANAGSSVSANTLIDQPPYQSDPVSQMILNILGTPDSSYCVNKSGGVSNGTNPNGTQEPCDALKVNGTGTNYTLFQNQVMENTIGKLPGVTEFYNLSTNKNILAQLNGNALIAPLNYTGSSDSSQSNSATTASSSGLTADTDNQIQVASNFIRYVSGAVAPTLLPNKAAYANVLSTANDDTNPAEQAQAQAILSNYLVNLRIYAAQTSVGVSNLYYILSRRLPQTVGQTTLPSQALNEYNMATWRIYKPTTTQNGAQNGSSSTQQDSQWLDKINAGTPAQVQKEIAVLLSEINYQLYLDRQIQERLLFNSSVSILQGTKATQPSSDLSNQSISASNASPFTSTN